MKLIIEENEQKMSESAMFILLGAMMQDKRVNISLTSGRSPKTMYDMMIPYVKNQAKFKDIEYYLFDENPYIDEPYGPNWKDMQELFFKAANIPDERIHIMTSNDWQDYDNKIRNAGGMDIFVVIVLVVHLLTVILTVLISRKSRPLIQIMETVLDNLIL